MIRDFFKFEQRGAKDIRTEVMAGITTFTTMAYILVVNPAMLAETGMEAGREFSATALATGLATLIMGLYANLPLTVAPGMGLNAFFTYSVCLGMGFSWSFALTAVLAEGILFLILTKTGLRESIINGMPGSLNHAIVAGLGLFIVTIGLENAGLVVTDSGLLLPNPDPMSSEILVAFIGLSITIALMYFKVRGALLIGIVVTTLIGIPFDVTAWYGGGLKPQMPYLFSFAFREAAEHFLDFLLITATLTLTDLFEEVGTLQGCLGITNLVRKDGTITDCKQALYADTAGKLIAAVLGTSSMTIYVESASGVAAGGRTGLTSVVTAALFFLSLLLSPLFLSIPSAATAPVLIIVGMMMAAPFKKIKFNDPIEAIPAILCILVMVFTFSIFKGIAVGVISYVLLKLISGRRREITPIVWITLILVLIKIGIALFGKNG